MHYSQPAVIQFASSSSFFISQAIMSFKAEGDSRLQELKRKGQSLSGQDLEERKKQEFQQKVRDAEEQWMRVLRYANQACEQAERQFAQEGQLRGFEALRENTRSWLEEKQQTLVSLDNQADPEKTINTAQVGLNSVCGPSNNFHH